MPQSKSGHEAFSLSREDLTEKLSELDARRQEVIHPPQGFRSIYYKGKGMKTRTKLAKDCLAKIDEERTTLLKYERRTYGVKQDEQPTTTHKRRAITPATSKVEA